METFLGIVILLFVGFMVFLFIEAPGIAVTIIVVPVAIIITVKIVKKSIQNKRRERIAAEDTERRLRAEREAAALEKQKLLAQQNLVERYKNSDQLVVMLNFLCGIGNARKLPDTIRIDDEGVLATCNGQSTYYNFIHHRLPTLQCARECGTCDYERYILRPQVAMAEAINSLLSYEYDISDNAKRTFKESEDGITWFYASDHVIMKLKPRYSF